MQMIKTKKRFGQLEVKTICVGLVTAIFATLILSGIGALVFNALKIIAVKMIAPVSTVCVAVGCFIGALTCRATTKGRGVVIGSIISVSIILIIILMSLLLDDTVFSYMSILKSCVILISGCCGGYLSVSERKRKKRR